MLEVSQVIQCKQLAGQGVPIREISRRLEISRNTVRRYLRGAPAGVYRLSQKRPQPRQDEVRPRVEEMLEKERRDAPPRKQRLTAARIHRLLAEEGFDVSERTVRTVVREVRRGLRDPLAHAYLPLSYEPGVDAQVDFMEGVVLSESGERQKLFVLIVRACYSRRAFRWATSSQTREAVLEGLIRAFEFFEGVFQNLWFDNLTPVVRRVLKGRDRELQRAFASFQAHHGFHAQFCRPGKGNEKGGVENEVRRTRREVFAPLPRVDGPGGLQVELDLLAERDLGRKLRAHELTVGELWEHERPRLLALPQTPFDPATTRSCSVTKHGWIQTGTNFYSVPVHLVGQTVTVKLRAEEVEILDPRGTVARHARRFGRGHMVLDLEHYLPLLERKHRGLDRAVPVRQWLERAPECWRRLLEALRRRSGEVRGSQEFVEALKLCQRFGAERMSAAVEKTMLSMEISLPVIRYHLGLEEEQVRGAVKSIDYSGPSVAHGQATDYLEVLRGH